jgi:hypothetical protein
MMHAPAWRATRADVRTCRKADVRAAENRHVKILV